MKPEKARAKLVRKPRRLRSSVRVAPETLAQFERGLYETCPDVLTTESAIDDERVNLGNDRWSNYLTREQAGAGTCREDAREGAFRSDCQEHGVYRGFDT